MITDISLLTTFSSVSLGSFFGLVLNPVSISNDQRHWNFSYYILGVGTVGVGIYQAFINSNQMLDFSNALPYHVIFAFVSGLLLISITKIKFFDYPAW